MEVHSSNRLQWSRLLETDRAEVGLRRARVCRTVYAEWVGVICETASSRLHGLGSEGAEQPQLPHDEALTNVNGRVKKLGSGVCMPSRCCTCSQTPGHVRCAQDVCTSSRANRVRIHTIRLRCQGPQKPSLRYNSARAGLCRGLQVFLKALTGICGRVRTRSTLPSPIGVAATVDFGIGMRLLQFL